jgi:hypothetical protein
LSWDVVRLITNTSQDRHRQAHQQRQLHVHHTDMKGPNAVGRENACRIAARVQARLDPTPVTHLIFLIIALASPGVKSCRRKRDSAAPPGSRRS